jgi:Ca2+-binding RTX toxin-like protein
MSVKFGTTGNDNSTLDANLEPDGSDYVFAGEGNDFIDASQSPLGDNSLYGGKGKDTLLGGNGDRLFGGDSDDEIHVGGKNTALGGRGNDRLDASNGKGGNLLYGGEGDDTIIAGSNDLLFGGEGDDVIIAGNGGAVIRGGEGTDKFVIAKAAIPESSNTIVDYDTSSEILIIGGLGLNFEDLELTQDGENAIISTESGDELAVLKNVQVTDLGEANFSFEGYDSGNGSVNAFTTADELAIIKLMARYDIALDEQDVETAVDTYTDDATLSNLDGSVTGKEAIQQVHEFLLAPASPDQPNRREPGRRHVTVNIVIEPTSDTTAVGKSYLLVFGASDELQFVANAVQEDEFRKENGEWKISSRKIIDDPGFRNSNLRGADGYIENIGTIGNDFLVGTTGDDSFDGNEGDDKIYGLAGNDQLIGGRGSDWLQGDTGNDDLVGGDRSDILIGGMGMDNLTGGGGHPLLDRGDIFVVQPYGIVGEENSDFILDFEVEKDVLGLRGISFGQLSIVQDGADTKIWNAGSKELLSVLMNVQSTDVTADSFIDFMGS